MRLLIAWLIVCGALASGAQKLLVVSVDGLDNRYLRDRDSMGLKIPNIRRLLREGQVSAGVVGIVPTITWPSHTTIITGVTPEKHGILSNRLPGGDYPWSAKLLKSRTLLDAAHEAGKKTATITWPVTVDAPVDFNLPEYFQRRRGGAMDLRSIESKCVPADLVSRISKAYPSFAQEWMDDRTRTQAVVYLLKNERPDLMLVHLVDLDSEQHDDGPFTRESVAILEYTDELIGQMLAALPKDYAVALVSDHGFERVEREVKLEIPGVRARGGIAVSENAGATAALAKADGVGRRIPREELERFSPALLKADAVYEAAPGVMFGPETGKPKEAGNHGHWPMRYRAVYVLWGPGVKAGAVPEISQTELVGKLAGVMGVAWK